jgi:hypothetical protein
MDASNSSSGVSREPSTDPAILHAEERLSDFNWDDLYRRFEERIRSCEAQEAQLFEEFNHLMAVQTPYLALLV